MTGQLQSFEENSELLESDYPIATLAQRHIELQIAVASSSGLVKTICGFIQLVLYCVVGVAVVIVVAVVAFGMGNWTMRGTTLVAWGGMILYGTIILSFIYCGIVVPIRALDTNSKMKKLIRELLNGGESEREFAKYTGRYYSTITRCLIASSLLAAVTAFLVHDPMMAALGNPWTDLITIAIMLIGSRILTIVLELPFMAKLGKENPAFYAAISI